MNNLSDLYYAAIEQYDQMVPTGPSYDYCKAECDRREKKMMNTFSDEQKNLFEHFMEGYFEVEAMKEKELYRYAVSLGIRLTAEAFMTTVDMN